MIFLLSFFFAAFAKVRLLTIDFGGQPDYYVIHKDFLGHRTVYVMVESIFSVFFLRFVIFIYFFPSLSLCRLWIFAIQTC